MPNISEIIDDIKQKIKLGKKNDTTPLEDDSEDEFSFVLDEETTAESDNDLVAANEELLAKMGELESKFPKIEMMVTNLRKENENLRSDIHNINENFQDMMALYEVVSNQINPFIGISKVTATSMEKVEKIEHESTNLKKRVEELQNDVVILANVYLQEHDIDLDGVINEILAEEEFSKAILGEDSDDW
ncbi:flagella accessory protein C [Methanococcus voltae]|uniref:Putative flagella-related protein C n=2 Tax=Methanococcus voltae TaxID=2188 RepID=FLAC_METVO|nr:flagella accessory protein C [Methanococcus voltae]O06636.1 RecName: Full=Putative flagella-related protein C [Methanococcus voltae]AAB57827.1 putative flagella-related protein C [Methanococcus voltae PS]MBP2172367.1 flagellar protein FlaC [Methanococcus voltae]MBP2200677.1 flagellar protein FlaC [Methanococcus voltae]